MGKPDLSVGKLAREDKVHRVGENEIIIHYDEKNKFLVGLVDQLIAACAGKRALLQHSWADDNRTERLIVTLPAVGE